MKRTKLRNSRPKAVLGALIPAGISLAGSIINGIGAARQARSEADAIEEQSRMQADMIKSINENNNRLQERLIASNKEQNQRMVNAYLNSAMQQGALNVDSRYRAGRIQVAKGGRLGANRASLLRGLNNNVEVEGGELIITPNIPPQATDGGQIIPIGQTEDGNVISIAVGPSHEQKHPSINGKREGGVGMDVNGETMILSRHTHNGFNPVKAVAQGMAPEDAFQIQENNKIMDRVNYKTPVGRRRLRYGGRPKAPWGNLYDGNFGNGYTLPSDFGLESNVRKALGLTLNTTPNFSFNNGGSNYNLKSSNPTNVNIRGNFWNSPLGATTITGAGNLLGWGATTIGNAIAAQHQKSGLRRGTKAYLDAISNPAMVDVSNINLNKVIAPLIAPPTQNNAALSSAERSLYRTIRDINRGTLSSAAAQNRATIAEINSQDIRNKIYNDDAQRADEVSKFNATSILDAQKTNANIGAEEAKLKLQGDIQNAETKNQFAQLRADALMNLEQGLGEIRSRRSLAGWSGAANMFGNTAQTYQNQFNSYNQNLFNLLSAIAGSINEASAKRSLNIGSYFYPSLRNIYNNLV